MPKSWEADSIGSVPVLGWKESPQAVGVVRHALPLMRVSDNLDIVTINKLPNHDEEVCEAMEIGQYLAAHGVKCQFYARRKGGGDNSESDTLLRHAIQYNRDLIIIGGYSHSRYREMISGGMTRDLIKHSSIPVLLAH